MGTGSTLCHRPRRLPDSLGPVYHQTKGCVCVCVCSCARVVGVHHVDPCSEENISKEWPRASARSLAVLDFEKYVPGFSGGSQFPHQTPFYLPVPLHFLPYHFSLTYMRSRLTGMPPPPPLRTPLFKTNKNKNQIPLCLFKPNQTHTPGY